MRNRRLRYACILSIVWSTGAASIDDANEDTNRRLNLLTAGPSSVAPDTPSPSSVTPIARKTITPTIASSLTQTRRPAPIKDRDVDTKSPSLAWSPTTSPYPTIPEDIDMRRWYLGPSSATNSGAARHKSILFDTDRDTKPPTASAIDTQSPTDAAKDDTITPSAAPTSLTPTRLPTELPTVSADKAVESLPPPTTIVLASESPSMPASSDQPSYSSAAPTAPLVDDTEAPSDVPSDFPSNAPSLEASSVPSNRPTFAVSDFPSGIPSTILSTNPSTSPTTSVSIKETSNSPAPSTSRADSWCINQMMNGEHSRVFQSKAVFTKFVKAFAKHETTDELEPWNHFVDLPEVLQQVFYSLRHATDSNQPDILSLACASIDAAIEVYNAPTVAPSSPVAELTNLPVIISEKEDVTEEPTQHETITETQQPTSYNFISDAPTHHTQVSPNNTTSSPTGSISDEPDEASEAPFPSFGSLTDTSVGYKKAAWQISVIVSSAGMLLT